MRKTRPVLKIEIVLVAGILLFILSRIGFGTPFGAGNAAQFLRSGVGARAIGMGGAFVAVADDVNAAYWNPAGLIQSARVSVGGAYESRFGGLERSQCVAGSLFSPTRGVGFIWVHLDMCSVYSVAAAVGLGKFAVGITGKMYRFSTLGQSASGVGIDVGGLYRTSLNGVDVAFAVTSDDIGWSKIRWREYTSTDYTAWTTRLGTGIEFQTWFGAWLIAADWEIALRRPPHQGETNYFSSALENSVNCGTEAWLGKLALRAGLAGISITGGKLSAQATLGIGLRTQGIALDVAWVSSELGSTYILSVEVQVQPPIGGNK